MRVNEINPRLNIPQAQFLAMPHKFRAFVAGFGSGKTWTGCSALAQKSWEYPKLNLGYFAPTFAHINDIFYPTIEEVLFDWGLNCKIKESKKEVEIYRGRQYRSTVKCRSMDDPSSIVGFKICHALIDELDILPAAKARTAWRKIIARMRYKVDGLQNGVDVTTTPEGFKFTYEQFVEQLDKKPELRGLYGLLHASTYDNEKNLPDDYISSLVSSYPEQLIDAYLKGKFVNLTSGSIYREFDRTLNNCDTTITRGDHLHIGMDFNVMKMAASTMLIHEGTPHYVDELSDLADTPAMIEALHKRYSSGNHKITIYPDASGQNTSSKNANESDHILLRNAGFEVLVNSVNPSVKDRINAVNAQIRNATGRRRLKVNTRKCPNITANLEKQVWNKHGLPDKSAGNDHQNDATGYPIAWHWPVERPRPTNLPKFNNTIGDSYAGM